MTPFVYTAPAARVVFGSGTRAALADEVRTLACRRALILSTPPQRGDAAQLAAAESRYLDSDAVFGVKNALIATFGKNAVTGSGRFLNYHFGLKPLSREGAKQPRESLTAVRTEA